MSLLLKPPPIRGALQVEIVNLEAYAYDGECIAKAEELGKPGLVDIRPLPVWFWRLMPGIPARNLTSADLLVQQWTVLCAC